MVSIGAGTEAAVEANRSAATCVCHAAPRTSPVAALSVGEGFARGAGWMASAVGWWWAGWLTASRRLGGDPETFARHR